MDMKLSEEQMQLRDTARKFLEEECTAEFVREMEKSETGFSRKMWKQMAEMGWLGIALPEDCGGLGMGTVDLVLLAKELGRHDLPEPVPLDGRDRRRGDRAGRQRGAEAALPAEIIDGETRRRLRLPGASPRLRPRA